MMPDDRSGGKISLEDLLRLKRAERPPADFWVAFDRELRTRQLAAAVGKRRWWFGLPRAFARYQMPMGAAAVLAVTFLTLREYREPGLEPAFGPAPLASRVLEVQNDSVGDEPSMVNESFSVIDPAVAAAVAASLRVEQEAPQREEPAARVAAAPRSSLPARGWASPVELTPSARSIAANLAAVEAELHLPSSLPVVAVAAREPLAQLTPPQDSRRERLLAYAATDTREFASEHDGPRATERIGSRISETELYDTVRRLSGGGDRLTLKF